MNIGYVNVCIAPLRTEPNHHSEMLSQLLFGEGFTLLNQQKDWIFISCLHDETEAWVHKTQVRLLNEKQADKYKKSKKSIAFDAFHTAISKEEHIPIVIGSDLPNFDGLSFKIEQEKIVYNGQVIQIEQQNPPVHLLEKICLKYLHSPFLWGGRSPFGIDASGLTQMVFKLLGVPLPRKIADQENQGRRIDFLTLAREGDLLFTKDELDQDHVGIYLGDSKLIHAYGRVKVDLIDAHGIFNEQKKAYSHKLTGIRRYV